MNPKLPRPTEPIAGPGGLITRSWRDYLSSLAVGGDLTGLWAAIEEIRAEIGQGGGIPSDARVYGELSIESFGLLADGLVRLTLVNDQIAPAPGSYYGTNADGARGFHALPAPPAGGSSVPYFIPEGQTFNAAEFQQALFAMTIDVEGVLDVDGYLIEVT